MYMEDVDLGDRMNRAGWLSVTCPAPRSCMTKGHSTGRDPGRNLRPIDPGTYIYLSDRHSGVVAGPVEGGR